MGMRRMEQETDTFMFMALDDRGEERLIIFCHNAGSKSSGKGRMAAERMVNDLIQDRLRGGNSGGGRGDSRGRNGGGRGDSRGRRRSPPRQRSDSRRRSPPRKRSPSRRRNDSRRR